MAVKKTVAEEATEEVKTEKPVEEFGWDDMREVFIPRSGSADDRDMYVSVNDRNYQVPRGKREMVPYPIWERVQIKLEAEAALMDTYETVPNKG